MQLSITDHLADALKEALNRAGLPVPESVFWEVPREESHGDYATNVAMTLAQQARSAPRAVAEAIVAHFPETPAVDRLEVAGPGFLNAFLRPRWCAEALRHILAAGAGYGTSEAGKGKRYRLEFVSANPTGPLVIVNARAAAVGDALARILRSLGSTVESQYYVNDAGNQVLTLARAIAALTAAGHTYEQDGALWFRSPEGSDDEGRVLRKSDGELTYFGVDIGFHHFVKFADVDCVIDFLGPDHHGYVARIRAAMEALGHPPESFDVIIVQLVTLLREGQPVRMSKRRGEFVLMEELLEEVGPDAARFTFLTRRHDSPLEFDLAVATRRSADNPVFYVQYCHARVSSLFRNAATLALDIPAWTEVDFTLLALPEEQALIKRLLQYPDLLAGAARAREPHRVAYYLTDLAGA